MILIVSKNDVEKIQAELLSSGEETFIIGEIR
jgi:phosphoribosylaminoimidazole (AIR) synthetase